MKAGPLNSSVEAAAAGTEEGEEVRGRNGKSNGISGRSVAIRTALALACN